MTARSSKRKPRWRGRFVLPAGRAATFDDCRGRHKWTEFADEKGARWAYCRTCGHLRPA